MVEAKKKTIKKDQKVTKKKVFKTKDTTAKSKAKKYFYGVGGRKTSRARIRLYTGKGGIIINDKKGEVYLTKPFLGIIKLPLVLTNNEGKFDISIKVSGGGRHSQTEAIRHGIARALIVYNQDLKTTLKKAGYLTRDPRKKRA